MFFVENYRSKIINSRKFFYLISKFLYASIIAFLTYKQKSTLNISIRCRIAIYVLTQLKYRTWIKHLCTSHLQFFIFLILFFLTSYFCAHFYTLQHVCNYL
ncbi:hypothetical protein PUN28_017686 [Cardiocondyla obscurior]|uniref:Uncharacterized protein n=1 Tax=Cardiocondyla obscurior TaxID=286306 RepID=A0AAW2EP08_9HYME